MRLSFFIPVLFWGFVLQAAPSIEQDMQHIQGFMKKTWHTPERPLLFGPLLVQGDFAVADWWQQNKGGRAVLKRIHGKWQLLLCGGAGIKKSELWMELGMSTEQSHSLLAQLQRAESSLSHAQQQQLDSFGSTIKMGAGHGTEQAAVHGSEHQSGQH